MKGANRKRIICFLIFMLFLIPSAAPADPFSFRAILTDSCDGPVSLTISSITYISFSAFDARRLEQLNRLLGHVSVSITIDGDASLTSFAVDGTESFSVTASETEKGLLSCYSFDPERGYLEGKDDEAANPVTGFSEDVFMRLNTMADRFYSFFDTMKDFSGGQRREEDVSLSFKGFGKAVRRITLSFSPDYVREHFPDELAGAAGTEEQKRIIRGMFFSGTQRVILLYDAEGRLIRISYDGRTGTDEDNLRSVSLVWKCLRTDTATRDSITLKSPAVSGYDRDNLTFTRELASGDGAKQVMNWKIQLDRKRDQERKLIKLDADFEEDETALSGKTEYSERQNGKTKSSSVRCRLSKENAGEYTGTLEIADYSGKIEKRRIRVLLTVKPGETIDRKEIGPAGVVDTESSEGKTRREELRQKLSQVLVRSLISLPADDIAFLIEDIPDDVWKEIIQ